MRFSYVKYDDKSVALQEEAKDLCEKLEAFIALKLGHGRPQSLAMTDLEKTYMWIGKAIRDNQINRNSQVDHIPERSSSDKGV